MAKWRFYSYDVWGRGADAWVNDVFKTDLVLDLPENPKDSEVIDAIIENIGDKVTVDKVSYSEDAVYLMIPVVYTDEETGETVESEEYYGEIRREWEFFEDGERA